MISISELLPPSMVTLSLGASDLNGAVEEVLALFQADTRVPDPSALRESVLERNAPAIACGDCGICIAHGRTNSVKSLVLAAGRAPKGFSAPGIRQPVRLVFVAGIPSALSSEYLRIVGAIARVCNNHETLGKLLGVSSAAKFVELLSAGETRL